MVSTLAALASAFPAFALSLGFFLVLLGTAGSQVPMIQGGWGLITVGLIVEFVLPISRRLR